MVEIAGFVCKNYYTTFMIICDHLRSNLGRHSIDDISGCVMGLNVGKV